MPTILAVVETSLARISEGIRLAVSAYLVIRDVKKPLKYKKK